MTQEDTRTAFEKKLEEQIAAEQTKAGIDPETAESAESATAPEEEAETTTEPEGGEDSALAEAQAALEAAKDQHLRLHAEFDNFRRRTARDMDQLRKTAAAGLIRELLPVLDNLERALQHAADNSGSLSQGVEMVVQQMSSVLSAAGLEPIPALGETFDPQVHEALAQQPSDEHPADAVVQEYERGYRLGGEVLRPAKVVVSSGPAPEAAASEPQAEEEE